MELGDVVTRNEEENFDRLFYARKMQLHQNEMAL